MAKRGRARKEAKRGLPHFYGRHAVEAALDNEDREIKRLFLTREAAATLVLPDNIPVQYCEVTDLARHVPKDAPHQGMVAEVMPLDELYLADVMDAGETATLLFLDQVTDPHNVGAIFRSAAAFGAVAVVTQDRHAPPESGVVAKAASGALEMVPWIRVVNLSRALIEAAEAGYWRIGLAGESEMLLPDALTPGRNALVLGAEGEGLRHNVGEHCDQLAKLPISDRMESLNVSNAAAIALYATAMRG